MQIRSILVLLTVLAIAVLAAFNWAALSAPVLVSLGVMSFEAPLGLLMLGLTALLAVVCVAYVLSLQGSVLLETRRHTKELQAQRELADKAEASRFTELGELVRGQTAQLEARLQALEEVLRREVRENANAVAASLGEMDDRMHGEGVQRLPPP